MKSTLVLAALIMMSGSVFADQNVRSDMQLNSEYGAPHARSSPNKSRFIDNSSQGHITSNTTQERKQDKVFTFPAYNYGHGGYNGHGYDYTQ